MPKTPIKTPANYVTSTAMAFADTDGTALPVAASTPFPVNHILQTTTALVGTTSQTVLAGPYMPAIGRSVMLTLTGNWSGSVQLMRTSAGSSTPLATTIGGGSWGFYTVNCCEALWDEGEKGAGLYLQITLTSGTLSYRVAQ